MERNIRNATLEDRENIVNFLENAKVESAGIDDILDYFLLLEDEQDGIQATLGIEPVQEFGLLRSFVTTNTTNQQDLILMFQQILLLARDNEMKCLFLATNKSTTLPFFNLLGFQACERNNLPAVLSSLDHVKSIVNVDNSIFMCLNL